MAYPSHPRVPVSCPHGFMGRYTVVPGDTMFFIAQRYGVSLNALIAANPHIPDPNWIYPGDVLCVPGPKPPPPPPPPPPFAKPPCCLVMQGLLGAPPGIAGTAMLYRDAMGTPSVGVVAALPPPSFWGDFDQYVAGVTLGPEVAAVQLYPIPETANNWAAAWPLPPRIPPVPSARIEIRPVNTELGAIAEPVLFGFLARCR